MEVSGMPYISAKRLPLVSGWPVTSAVIFAVCDLAQARMKMPEMVPRPTAAYPIGFTGGPAAGCAASEGADEGVCAKAGVCAAATARAERRRNSRRSKGDIGIGRKDKLAYEALSNGSDGRRVTPLSPVSYTHL